MWYSEWNVLVVDDEADVLQLTKLVMKNFEVEGVPVSVHTASSKAEAIELIRAKFSEPVGSGGLAVAFIDVVMETDTAGLELCNFIRNEMHNSYTQLYIRTGQPGVAPEREVIDRYNITGYFTKVEATEDKLYTLVKSGARQFLFEEFALVMQMMVNGAITAFTVSQEQISRALTEGIGSFLAQRGDVNPVALWVGDELVMRVGFSEQEAWDFRERLIDRPGMQISPMGDEAIIDLDKLDALIKVAASPTNPPVIFITDNQLLPVDMFIPTMMSWMLRSIGTLWQQAGERERA